MSLLRQGTLFGLTVLLAAAIGLFSTRNPFTPASYVGYMTRGTLVGHAHFIGLQTGPISPECGWLLHVINWPTRRSPGRTPCCPPTV